MIDLIEPYADRDPQFLEEWNPRGWRLKVYGVPYRRDAVRPELVDMAKELALTKLPDPAITDSRYGVGFVGIHDGRGGVYTWCNWWENENELHHHLWGGTTPQNLEYASPSGLFACVFEMRVIVAEREAWIDTVLNNSNGPDLDAYLARTQT